MELEGGLFSHCGNILNLLNFVLLSDSTHIFSSLITFMLFQVEINPSTSWLLIMITLKNRIKKW